MVTFYKRGVTFLNYYQIDTRANIILTRSSAKKNRLQPHRADDYRYICKAVTFDYIDSISTFEYPISLRICRFEVADGVFQTIVTNLPAEQFSLEDIIYIIS